MVPLIRVVTGAGWSWPGYCYRDCGKISWNLIRIIMHAGGWLVCWRTLNPKMCFSLSCLTEVRPVEVPLCQITQSRSTESTGKQGEAATTYNHLNVYCQQRARGNTIWRSDRNDHSLTLHVKSVQQDFFCGCLSALIQGFELENSQSNCKNGNLMANKGIRKESDSYRDKNVLSSQCFFHVFWHISGEKKWKLKQWRKTIMPRFIWTAVFSSELLSGCVWWKSL